MRPSLGNWGAPEIPRQPPYCLAAELRNLVSGIRYAPPAPRQRGLGPGVEPAPHSSITRACRALDTYPRPCNGAIKGYGHGAFSVPFRAFFAPARRPKVGRKWTIKGPKTHQKHTEKTP